MPNSRPEREPGHPKAASQRVSVGKVAQGVSASEWPARSARLEPSSCSRRRWKRHQPNPAALTGYMSRVTPGMWMIGELPPQAGWIIPEGPLRKAVVSGLRNQSDDDSFRKPRSLTRGFLLATKERLMPCVACPFAFTDESETVQNLGCLPTLPSLVPHRGGLMASPVRDRFPKFPRSRSGPCRSTGPTTVAPSRNR